MEEKNFKNRIEKLTQCCIQEMKSIGIEPYKNIFEVTVNRRAKRRLGCCRKIVRGSKKGFEIQIADCLCGKDDITVKTIIIHELLHTCKGCFNHGAKWKSLSRCVNEKLGYNVTTTADYDALDIEVQVEEKKYRYKVICMDCGMESYRYRKSKVTEHPELYICKRCGGKLRVEKI